MKNQETKIGIILRCMFFAASLIGLSNRVTTSDVDVSSSSGLAGDETRSYHSLQPCDSDKLSWGSDEGDCLLLPSFDRHHIDPMSMMNPLSLDLDVEKSKSNLWVAQYLPAIDVKSEPASPVAQALPKSSFKKIGNDPETRKFIDWFHSKYCNVAENQKAESLRQDLFSRGTHDAAKRSAVVHKMKELDSIVNLLSVRHISLRNANVQIGMLREESAELLAGVKLCESK